MLDKLGLNLLLYLGRWFHFFDKIKVVIREDIVIKLRDYCNGVRTDNDYFEAGVLL